MSELVRVGVIGAGTMGGGFVRTVAGTSLRYRAEVVSVCDADEERARRLAERVHARSYADVEGMLSREPLDAVYLAVPDPAHKPPLLACIAAGVPVLVEKPLATTNDDAAEIVHAAHRAGVLVEVNFSNRWNPPFAKARETIARGDIGEVIGINAHLSNTLAIPRSMPWASSTTAGWFLLSHVFDLASWLTGAEAESVIGLGHTGVLSAEGIDTFDLIHASVHYADGASGVYEASWILPTSRPSPVDFAFQIAGTTGTIGIDTTNQMIVVSDEDAVSFPAVLDWTSERLHSFFDSVEAGRDDQDLLGAGVENTRQLVALHESLVADRPTVVPVGGGRE